jgi:threonine dehydrogenase-like Zn-dependent dehydrogenase
VLVTGAGPIGLLAALLGAQRGLDVHVFDLASEGTKPELARGLGAVYHHESMEEAGSVDIVIEATGADEVVVDALAQTAAPGIVCLTGVSPAGRTQEVDVGKLNRTLVLENDVVFGSVNANRRHYEAAAEALGRADREWLRGMITRRLPLDRFPDALEKRDGEVKVVVDLQGQ